MVSSPYQYPEQWRKSIVPHGPLVSGPTFARPCGDAAPTNALPTPKPKPWLPMKSGETGGDAGRVGVISSSGGSGVGAAVEQAASATMQAAARRGMSGGKRAGGGSSRLFFRRGLKFRESGGRMKGGQGGADSVPIKENRHAQARCVVPVPR